MNQRNLLEGGKLSRRSLLGGMTLAAVAPVVRAASPRALVQSPAGTTVADGFQPRCQHAGVSLPSGWVFLSGGYQFLDSGSPLQSAQLYDPMQDEWHRAAPMATGRARHAAVALPNGDVVVLGGMGTSGLLSTVEVFLAGRNEWVRMRPMRIPRADHSVAFVDGDLLITGGITGTSIAPSTAGAEIYRLGNRRGA